MSEPEVVGRVETLNPFASQPATLETSQPKISVWEFAEECVCVCVLLLKAPKRVRAGVRTFVQPSV